MVEKPAGNEVTHVPILARLSLKDLSPRGPSARGANFILSKGASSSSRAAGNAQEKGDAEPDQGSKGDRKAQLYQQSTEMEAFLYLLYNNIDYMVFPGGSEVKNPPAM